MRDRVRMHTKFMIFVIIGSLLVATINSSSTQFVFADKSNVTSKVTDKGAIKLGSDCIKNMDGTYSCTQDEFLKEDGTNDEYNSPAKTPNTGGPVPIPYPNTNN